MKQKKRVKVLSFMMAFILVMQTFVGASGQMFAKASSGLGMEEDLSQENLQNLNGLNVTSGSAIGVNANQWQVPEYGTGFTVVPDTGMTVIQSEDDPEYYTDNYWNTLDKNKQPGTTVLASHEVNVVSGSSIGIDGVWHGAKLDETNFISGVRLSQDVSAQKSYFAFDNQMACFGAGISNISEDPTREVHTIIDNIKLDDNAKDKLVLRYSTKTIATWINSTFCPLGNTYTYLDNLGNLSSNRHWALSLPDSSPVGTGYYFKPSEKDLNLRFVENMDEFNNKKTYLELWLNHDTSSNASYSYYLFKNLRASDPIGSQRDYMDKNVAATIANTKDVQAAFYKQTNIVSANIWAEQGAAVEYSGIDKFTVNSKASVMMRKQAGILEAAIAEPTGTGQGIIEVIIDTNGYEVVAKDENIDVDLTTPGKIKLSIDVTGKNGETSKVSINTIPPALDGNLNEFSIVKGKSALIPTPEGFEGPVTWTSIFKDANGQPIKNVGSSKIKEELKPGETDGNRTEGITSTSHIASVEGIVEGGLISAKEKGTVYVIAVDKNGQKKEWKLKVSYTESENLPVVEPQDYKDLREKWISLLVGKNIDKNDTATMAAVEKINTQAQEIWNRYSYKNQPVCGGIPWKDEEGVKGNPNIEYQRDAVEFRSAFQNVLVMAKAYQVEHGALYHNREMLEDMIQILDWLTTNCYKPQPETDNWWTWEIGMPKDLIPTLILLSGELTAEQITNYTEGMLFFQPDPFHGGAIGTASTHVEGYRMQYAANRVDNSITAMGLGLLLEDNELMYLAQVASSSVLEFKTVEDSTLLAKNGFENGFYADGSYVDHQNIPYAGSYGIVVLDGIANVSSVLGNSPWQYDQEKTNILKTILLNTYGIGVYNGFMLDMFRGRAVSRKNVTDETIGCQVINNAILSLDTVEGQEKQELQNHIKNWVSSNSDYLDSLKELNQLSIKQKALAIINDSKITGNIPEVHQNYPLMDRVIHRTKNWLLGVSMFSERINNTEIMNGENLYGWHQGDGMTYLYNKDVTHYTDNYWNTVNPFRLPGTTTVSKNIGNGEKDSSGFYQKGDYVSKEDWVGGSMLSNYGVNGMSLSGDVVSEEIYEPNLRALKSYFMFEDQIVCLGAGIQDAESQYNVETTVENRKLKADGSNKITVNGNNLELPLIDVKVSDIVKENGLGTGTASMEGSKLTGAEWIHMEGNTEESDIGWYFPNSNSNLNIRKVASTGNWNNINITESEDVVTNYFELWFDHGKNPQNEEYSYVMLPGRSQNEMKEYAKDPSVEILANNSDVQAVYYKKDKVTGANFWNDKEVTVGDITSNKKASVIVKEDKDVLEIGVSDPTMKNTESIEIDLDKELDQIINVDENVTVTYGNGKIHISVDTEKTNGSTSYAVIKIKKEDNSTEPTRPEEPNKENPDNNGSDKGNNENSNEGSKDNTTTKKSVTIDKANNQVIETTVTSGKDKDNNAVDRIEEIIKSLDTAEIVEVRKKVNLVDAKTGEKVQTELIKDAKGNLIKAAVSTNGDSITKEVNKKKAVITATFSHRNILWAIAETSKDETGNIVYEAKLVLPVENLIKGLNKTKIEDVVLNVELPKELMNAANISISDIVVNKQLIQFAKDKSANMNLCVKNRNNDTLYSWSINGKDLKKSNKKIIDVNLALKTFKANELKPLYKILTDDKNKSEGIVIRFAHEGELPALATIKLYNNQKKYSKNQKLYLYYYNNEAAKFYELYHNQCNVLDKQILELKVQHCSDYVILPNILSNKVVVSLLDQVSVTPKVSSEIGKKKKLVVNSAGNAKISYESSNKNIVTVDKTGTMVGKKQGKAIIKIKVSIKGKERVLKTEVKVLKTEVKVSKNK